MNDAPNACPDCGSTNRTMIQDATNDEIVWSCEQGHTWRDGQDKEAAKPARSPGRSPSKKPGTPESETPKKAGTKE